MTKELSPDIENKLMNPQIRNVKIGIRNLRDIEILPLSMGDLNKIIAMVEKNLKDYLKKNPDGGTEINIGTFVVQTIKNNLKKVFALVMDKDEKELDDILNEVTPMQSSEIVKIVYEDNFYDPFEKNLKSLLKQTLGRLFQQQTQLEPLSENMDVTELKTSTESDGQKEE